MNTYTPEEFAKKYFDDDLFTIYNLIKQGELQYKEIVTDKKTGKTSISFSDEDYDNYLNLLTLKADADKEKTLADFFPDDELMYLLNML